MKQVNVMNKSHYIIEIDGFKFYPFKEMMIPERHDNFFKKVRSNINLRVGKYNNDYYKTKNGLIQGYNYNFCLDNSNQHKGKAYQEVIKTFSETIIENLPKNEAGITFRPLPGKNYNALNVRFFSSKRINEQGKCSVGPYDIFYSHGIGDKNYWIGKHIKDFNFAFVPGYTWLNRMRDTGYKGEIFIVGYTKLDRIFQNKVKKTQSKKPVVSWLPTHGYATRNKGRSSFPFFQSYISKLRKDFLFIDGKHPTTKLHSNQKQTPTINNLVNSDVVIADGGSTIYEAWILGKPVVFPDWICKRDIMNHFKHDENNLEYMIYNKSIGYHAKDINHMNELIEKAYNDGMKDEEKEFIANICPSYTYGKAGELFAKSLIEIRSKL